MRFGIVGTNFVSDSFMKGVSFVSEVTVSAVCSRKRENAEKFAEKYGIENVFDNYLDMIDSGKIDAIYLAVPNSMHHDMTIECLKRKMPTWCEKPLAGNLKQVEDMIETAKANDTYLHDGTVPMYSPNLKTIKEYLGKIGKVRRAVLMFGKYSSRYDAYLEGKNPTTFRPELYNGSTMDLGVYVLADAVALFGKPLDVYSQAAILESGADCAGTMVLKYDGFECIIMHSKVTDTQIVSEIQGEDGNIIIPHPSLLDEVFYKPRKKDETLVYNQAGLVKISEDVDDCFASQLRDFVDSCNKGYKESTLNPFQQVRDIHEVLTEARLKAGIRFDCD